MCHHLIGSGFFGKYLPCVFNAWAHVNENNLRGIEHFIKLNKRVVLNLQMTQLT